MKEVIEVHTLEPQHIIKKGDKVKINKVDILYVLDYSNDELENIIRHERKETAFLSRRIHHL